MNLYTQEQAAALAGYARGGSGSMVKVIKKHADRFVEGDHYVSVGKKPKFTDAGVRLICELTGHRNPPFYARDLEMREPNEPLLWENYYDFNWSNHARSLTDRQ